MTFQKLMIRYNGNFSSVMYMQHPIITFMEEMVEMSLANKLPNSQL